MLLFRSREAHTRSVAKAISWRILGSLDTFLLSWLFTQNVKAAGAIATTEVITKIILFYGHERVWARIPFGMTSKRRRARRGKGAKIGPPALAGSVGPRDQISRSLDLSGEV